MGTENVWLVFLLPGGVRGTGTGTVGHRTTPGISIPGSHSGVVGMVDMVDTNTGDATGPVRGGAGDKLYIQDVRRFCGFLALFRTEPQVSLRVDVAREQVCAKALLLSKSAMVVVSLDPSPASAGGVILQTRTGSCAGSVVVVTLDTATTIRAFDGLRRCLAAYFVLVPGDESLYVEARDEQNDVCGECTIRYVTVDDEDELDVPAWQWDASVECGADRILRGFFSSKEDMVVSYGQKPPCMQWCLSDTLYQSRQIWHVPREQQPTVVDRPLRYPLLHSTVQLIKQYLQFIEKGSVRVRFSDPDEHPLVFEAGVPGGFGTLTLLVSPRIDDNVDQ